MPTTLPPLSATVVGEASSGALLETEPPPGVDVVPELLGLPVLGTGGCSFYSPLDLSSNDFDGNGVGDDCDHCPDTPNEGQEDSEWDGLGDACDCRPFEVNPIPFDQDLIVTEQGLVGWTTNEPLGDIEALLYSGTIQEMWDDRGIEGVGCIAPIFQPRHPDRRPISEGARGFYYLAGARGSCADIPLGENSEGGIREPLVPCR